VSTLPIEIIPGHMRGLNAASERWPVIAPQVRARFAGGDQWPNAEAVNLLRVSPPITNEITLERLDRWRTAFADELADLERAVSAASQPGGFDSLADIDLRSAIYLAGRLLATLYNIPISEVRPNSLIPDGNQAAPTGFGQGPAFTGAPVMQADPVEEPAARPWLVAGQPGGGDAPGALSRDHGHRRVPATGPGAGFGWAQGLPGLVLEAQVRAGRRR